MPIFIKSQKVKRNKQNKEHNQWDFGKQPEKLVKSSSDQY